VLCNACGLFLKLHGRPRPISLKTDVIKSRNRVKTSQTRKRDSTDGQHVQQHLPSTGLAAAHPGLAHAALHHHPHSDSTATTDAPARFPSPGSISRSNTPGLHNPNIAPQHIFDTVSLAPDAFASPSMPAFALRQPSPTASSVNGTSHLHDPPQSYDALQAQNSHLRTRVSELEVINDLFRGRVGELEHGEHEARRAERSRGEEVQRLMLDLETANKCAAELERRLAELDGQTSPARKKAKHMAANDEADFVEPTKSTEPAAGSNLTMP